MYKVYDSLNCLKGTISFVFCLDLCHVVALCLLLMINLCLNRPASEVSYLGQSQNLGHL